MLHRSSTLEDMPSISEGPGGRVTDYRITDLGELMKANRIAPHFSANALAQARDQVGERFVAKKMSLFSS